MTSYELLDFYEEILNEVKKLGGYTEELSKLNAQLDINSNSILNLIYTEGINTANGNFINSLNKLRDSVINSVQDFAINKFNILGNYQKLIRVKDNVNTILSKYPTELTEEKEKIINILAMFEEVTSIIDEFLRKRQNSIIVELVIKIHKVVYEYNKFISSYDDIKEFMIKTENKIEESEDEKELKLHFYDEHINPEYFIENIQAIRDSYGIMCQIFGISSSEHELKVLKIESGSLLMKFIGDASVIAAFGFFVKKITELVFSKYTFEGQILRHKQVLDLLKEDAEVIAKYKELGSSIDFGKEDILKHHFQLSKSILKLVEKTTKIKIDDEEVSLEGRLKQKYLTESKKLLIEEPEDKTQSKRIGEEETRIDEIIENEEQ